MRKTASVSPADRLKIGRFPARPGAISVGMVPVTAIPGAANPGRVVMISGQTASPRCNQSGHEPPMIAIPPTDNCGSLQVTPDGSMLVAQSEG
jgi:hypothetical protein